MPVSALTPGRDFFERLFGRPADIVVTADEVMWRPAESAWLYVVVDTARAGNGLAAMSVGDLDATLAELGTRGIEPVSGFSQTEMWNRLSLVKGDSSQSPAA